MKFLQRYGTWLHVIGWAVFISLPLLTLPPFLWNPKDLYSIGMAQLVTSILIMVCFYQNLNRLTPGLLQGGSPNRFWLTMLAMLVAVVAVKMACFYIFPPAFENRPPAPAGGLTSPRRGPHSPWPGAPGAAISFIFAMLVASLMALFRQNARSEEIRQQMALEKVSTELAMLKLQVSPHFLFNTLNNIRWLARKKSEQTESAVVTLAQLLRYMIYQAQQEQVALRQEVEHLQHYIELQKMRLTDRHPVTFTVVGDVSAYRIEPLLFIPFVENAFKYGPAVREGGPIVIRLTVSDEKLVFETTNPNPETAVAENPEDSGIGITNVRKRLALHYPHRHLLDIREDKTIFRVTLTLLLHHEQTALHRH